MAMDRKTAFFGDRKRVSFGAWVRSRRRIHAIEQSVSQRGNGLKPLDKSPLSLHIYRRKKGENLRGG
jgi:hypothetical protein